MVNENHALNNLNLISAKQMSLLTGKSRSTVYRWVRAKSFPAPLKIGINSIAWTQEQYLEWLESKEVAKH